MSELAVVLWLGLQHPPNPKKQQNAAFFTFVNGTSNLPFSLFTFGVFPPTSALTPICQTVQMSRKAGVLCETTHQNPKDKWSTKRAKNPKKIV